MSGWVIFDLDDTIIATTPVYQKADHEFAALMRDLGLDYDTAYTMMAERQIVLNHAAGPSRYVSLLAMESTYQDLCAGVGGEASQGVVTMIARIHAHIFETPAEVREHAVPTLERLRQRGYQTCLYTRGDPEIQKRRVKQAELGKHIDRLEIVWRKDVGNYLALLGRLGCATRAAVAVGDSLRSDIWPALTAGSPAIWVQNPGGWAGEHTDEAVEGFLATTSLASVPELVDRCIGVPSLSVLAG